MKTIQLFREGKQIIATDGIMKVDGRFNKASIYREVRARNNRFAANFPHKIADQYAIYSNGINSNLGQLNNIKIMELQKHNSHCKLIGITINNKQFVYGQSNNGDNAGLEVYYQTDNRDKDFYYSRRFEPRKIPMLYDTLAMYLAKLLSYVPAGHKLTLEGTEYNELVVMFNMQPAKYLAA